jgi:hypothetical protein
VAFWRVAMVVHAELLAEGATAPAGDAPAGMNVFALERAPAGRALCAAAALVGTPGADNTAADRVTDAATGAADLPAAGDVAVLIVESLVAEFDFAEVSGAVGVAACCEDDETAAVIE